MVDNRSRSLSWFRCNVKIYTQFHTTHLFLVEPVEPVFSDISDCVEGRILFDTVTILFVVINAEKVTMMPLKERSQVTKFSPIFSFEQDCIPVGCDPPAR